MSIVPTFSSFRSVVLPRNRDVVPPTTTADGGFLIECSSRPKKKATAHHMKTRPRKTQPWDIKRKPTVYPPLPPLPPDWTLVSSGANEGGADAAPAAAAEAGLGESALQAPASSG